MLEVLAAWPTPALLKHAGKARIDAKLKKHGARRHTHWTTAILAALEEQTVTVIGAEAAGLVIPHLARQMISLHAQHVDVAAHLEAMVEAHPLYPVLTSMPGFVSQDRRDLHRRDLRQDLRQRRSASLLRRTGADHAPIWHLDQVRMRQPFRQQTLEAGVIPLSLRFH